MHGSALPMFSWIWYLVPCLLQDKAHGVKSRHVCWRIAQRSRSDRSGALR